MNKKKKKKNILTFSITEKYKRKNSKIYILNWKKIKKTAINETIRHDIPNNRQRNDKRED